jgi:hypothetical protein
MSTRDTPNSRHGSKIWRELEQLFQIFIYIYVCLGAFLLFRMSIASKQDVQFMHFGYAALKALVLAKFMLLGYWLHLEKRHRDKPLIYSVLYQALAFWLLLVVLSVLEEVVVARIHGQSISTAFDDILGSRLYRILAESLILFIVILNFVAFRQLGDSLGPGRLKRLFFVSRN